MENGFMENKNLYGNAVVGQSGGPTAAINATLAGVVRGALESKYINKIYGMKNGIEGFLAEKLVDLTKLFADENDIATLELTPAAALGSCRKKLKDDEIYKDFIELVIAKAKVGLYSDKSIACVPDDFKRQYFTKVGPSYKIADEIKARVEFKEHNLLKDAYPTDYHLIVCRNVLIYFTEEAKDEIFRKYCKSLAQGGILFIGSTEQILKAKELVEEYKKAKNEIGKEISNLFYKYADGRDCGLKDIDLYSYEAFDNWVKIANDHANQIRGGSSTTRIDLRVKKDDKGYYLVLSGRYLWISNEVIKFYVELTKKNMPVFLYDAEVIRDRLIGKGVVGIVPYKIFPRYCQSLFDVDVCDFMHLPYYPNEYNKYLKYIEWLDIDKTYLKEE